MRHTCTHVSADFTCTDHHGHQYGACTACRASLTRAGEHQPWRVCTAGEALRVALGTGGRAMVDLVALLRLMAALATMSPRPPRSATPRQRQAHLDRYAQLVVRAPVWGIRGAHVRTASGGISRGASGRADGGDQI